MSKPIVWAICGIAGAAITGCATMGFTYDEGSLKQQVSFDTNCPVEKIQLEQALEAGVGVTKFKLNVCGQEQRWTRMGTSYFQAGKEPVVPPQ